MIFEYVLFFSVYLLAIGLYVLITSRIIVRALVCLELVQNSVNINFVIFFDIFDSRQLKGNIFSIFIIVVAIAEVAIGLTIVSSIH